MLGLRKEYAVRTRRRASIPTEVWKAGCSGRLLQNRTYSSREQREETCGDRAQSLRGQSRRRLRSSSTARRSSRDGGTSLAGPRNKSSRSGGIVYYKGRGLLLPGDGEGLPREVAGAVPLSCTSIRLSRTLPCASPISFVSSRPHPSQKDIDLPTASSASSPACRCSIPAFYIKSQVTFGLAACILFSILNFSMKVMILDKILSLSGMAVNTTAAWKSRLFKSEMLTHPRFHTNDQGSSLGFVVADHGVALLGRVHLQHRKDHRHLLFILKGDEYG